MIDLFAGLGGASEPFLEAGWEVVRVDIDPGLLARAARGDRVTDLTADLSAWSWRGRRPLLVWASPPCNEFSREFLPWCRTGVAPSIDLALATKRIIEEIDPRFWVVENVQGAIRYFDPIFGRYRQGHRPVFLWGNFPSFEAKVKPWKEKLPSKRRAERAKIPIEISRGLLGALSREEGLSRG